MSGGIRTRLFAWLTFVTLPTAIASAAALHAIDTRLAERIETEMTNAAHGEAASLRRALSGYRRDADGLVASGGVRRLVRRHVRDGGATGTASSLDELAEHVRDRAARSGSEILAVRVVDREGRPLGESGDVHWRATDTRLLERAARERRTVFGDAFRNAGEDRLGLVTPILDARGAALGALLLEAQLRPLTRALGWHERLGETTEAYLVQRRADGVHEFITPLRFVSGAAFDPSVSPSAAFDIPLSSHIDEHQLAYAADYRGVETMIALEPIPGTNWTLAKKIDLSEARAPISEVRRIVGAALALACLLLLCGWVAYLHPLSRRLRHVARAASRVASGSHRAPIGDDIGDEIGEIARSIDRLARDLDEDIRLRNAAEERLRHQATHDALTGLFNRKHAADHIAALDAERRTAPLSVLFLDLDGFKAINDGQGHATGDEVLREVGVRVGEALAETPDSLLARWGGDEFVVVLPGVEREGASAIVRRVRALFDEPFRTATGAHRLGCSIGRSTTSAAGRAAEALEEADARMYVDKETRRAARDEVLAEWRRSA